MSNNIENFIKAFMQLSDSEKGQVYEIVKTLETGSLNERQIAIEKFESNASTINFAPSPGACPTCGK